MPRPDQPKIYHIVHHDRIRSILKDGFLWSDAQMNQRRGVGTTIGMGDIKQRRLKLPVSCHPPTFVGEYVPFYFCPRSIMLYVIYCANHPELAYKGGQQPIVHLEADLAETVAWAEANDKRWAFSLSNASATYTQFRSELAQLDEINWDAVQAQRWSGNGVSQSVKEGKQAEFLIKDAFPWHLVERIGVHSKGVAHQVHAAMNGAGRRRKVEIRREWYY